VLDLPSTIIPPAGYYTGSSNSPFTVQGSANTIPGYNWRSLPTGASLTKWQYNGTTGYNAVAFSNVGGANDERLDLFPNNDGAIILLYKQSAFEQGLLTKTSTAALPATVSSLPALTVATAGICASETFSFSGIPAAKLYTVNPATGNDNGYSRIQDGNCSPWDKSAPGNDHTPNVTNNDPGSGTVPSDGSLVVSPLFLNCNGGATLTSTLFYGITGTTGLATLANSFPVKVEIFDDLGTIGQYDPGVDVPLATNTINSFPSGTLTYTAGISPKLIILFTTANGCYDYVEARQASCIGLPVVLSYFSAERKNLTASLKWETSTEVNSRGFMIERNTGNNIWQEVGFVDSKAANGFSASTIKYEYTDPNNSKAITQYRIRQVDLNDNSKLSEVRSVRGIDQKGGIILYPNPSNDGKVNIVFEDRNVTRDLSVSDMGGRIVKQVKGISANSITIDNLVSGMYTIRVSVPATGEQIIEKIIVNKH
jgi:hypothetical protein